MTHDQQTLLMIKGAISELPPEQREACMRLVDQLRLMIESVNGQFGKAPVGELAIALVGAEIRMRSA